jgi:hypothetical protein
MEIDVQSSSPNGCLSAIRYREMSIPPETRYFLSLEKSLGIFSGPPTIPSRQEYHYQNKNSSKKNDMHFSQKGG